MIIDCAEVHIPTHTWKCLWIKHIGFDHEYVKSFRILLVNHKRFWNLSLFPFALNDIESFFASYPAGKQSPETINIEFKKGSKEKFS